VGGQVRDAVERPAERGEGCANIRFQGHEVKELSGLFELDGGLAEGG